MQKKMQGTGMIWEIFFYSAVLIWVTNDDVSVTLLKSVSLLQMGSLW